MASGTYNFSYGRDQIIRAALRKIGAIEAGDIPSAEMTLDGSDALNMMVKEWEASGIHVWLEQQGLLFLQPGQIEYQLSPTTTDSCAISPGVNNYTGTTTSASAAQGSSTLSVLSAVGIANGYHIGVVMTNGNLFWTTVSGVSGLNVTLASPLTNQVTGGAYVYTYQNIINVKPLRIPFARRLYLPSSIVTMLRPFSRSDYFDQPNKTSRGVPTQFYYSPQLSVGYFNVWPAPVDVNSAIAFTWYQPIQDFNVAGDTPDLPQEWISTLVFNLAVELAPEYGCPADVYQIVKAAAAEKLDKLSGWDREVEPTYFGVDFSPGGY